MSFPPVKRPVRQSGVGAFSNLTTAPNYQTNGGTLRNYAMAMSVPDGASALSLLFLNHQTVEATVNDHAVAAGSTAYPGGVFNINNPEGEWAAAGAPVTIPAAKGVSNNEREKRPGIAVGPRLPWRPIPRAAGELDGGTADLAFIRVYGAAGNATMPVGNEVANFPNLYDRVNGGMSILSTAPYTAANVTSSNQRNWVAATARETTPIFACFGLLATYDESYTVVMGAGDSILAGGSDGASGRTPFLFRATNRLRLCGKRASYFNGAISGSAMDSITIRTKDYLPLLKPDIVVIASYSTNNNAASSFPLSTQAGWDAAWAQAMETAQAVIAAGGVPVFVTPMPFSGFNPTSNVFRLNQLRRIIDSGYPYINVESLADSQGRWADPADTNDGTHPSEQCNDKLAGFAFPVLDALIA